MRYGPQWERPIIIVAAAGCMVSASVDLHAAPPPPPPSSKTSTTAAPWETTFEPVATESYVPKADASIVVVPAGPADPVRDEAASALVDTLRNSDRVKLVMDSAALGDVGALADEAIVSKSSQLPVDYVLVLRIFPGKSGATVVGTFYDKGGELVTAFTGQEGEALELNSESASGEGVSEGAAKSVADAVEEEPLPQGPELVPIDPEVAKQWNAEFLGVEPWSKTGEKKKGRDFGEMKLGTAGTAVPWPEFYERVGRPELGAKYDKRGPLKKNLTYAGAGIAGGGVAVGIVLMAIAGANPKTPQPYFGFTPSGALAGDGEPRAVWDPRFQAGMGLAIGVGVAGLGVMATGLIMKRHPISRLEVGQLAKKYNVELARKLGLLPGGAPSPTPAAQPTSKASFDLGPAWFARGAGVSVSGEF